MINVCLFGDCRESMRQMIAEGVKVQMCMTSPPYWGLRDYGTATWDGGEAGCDHVGSIERLAPPGTDKQASNRGTVSVRSGDCKCGARRIDSQLGMESTPEEREPNQLSDTGWTKSARTLGEIHGDGQGAQGVKGTHGLTDLQSGRNRRTVWTVATEPYSEAHFATFPTALIEPCILAGSRVGDVVFDPFLGSGTTAQVAQDLGRNWLGCELSQEYGKLQTRRTAQLGMALEPTEAGESW